MAWYVFAFVDERPGSRPGAGLGGPLAARRVPGGFAIVERRGDVPPVEFGTLRRHDAVVARIAARVPAILPVRFGTLLELEEIEEALADREAEITEAFDVVRDRVQFTWRRAAIARPRAGGAGAAVTSGTAYLRQAARAAKPVAPAAFRAAREKLRPLIAAERYQPATSALPDTLYHLVGKEESERYGLVATKLAAATSVVRVTGPFPAFAFTPELL
jgi:hypothetical protein